MLARLVVVLAALAALVTGTAGPGAAQGSVDGLDAVVEQEMSAAGVPGVAYAVVTEGQPTSVGARGVRRLGEDDEVTPDTPFVIGSISKSFTALAVMQLVEAGDLDLDTTLAETLDELADRPAADITTRQLLSHTSGFSTLQGNASYPRVEGRDALERRVAHLADVAPDHEPGERWEYSNLNYQLLGRVVEVVSGQAYDAYVAAHVLRPLGMTHSFVADGQVHDEMATGHRPWFGTRRALAPGPTERVSAPQGGVVASAADLARYLQTMMNGRDDVLSADGKAQMMRPAGPASPHYGLGWFVDPGSGQVWHGGTTPGVETLATMRPDRGTGAVVLTNAGSGIGFGETTQLLNAVTATALDLDYDGEGSRWSQKALYIALLLLPVGYLLSMLWAWRHRGALRAKSGVAGRFSLWFPLLTTTAAAWVLLFLVPRLFGAPLATIRLFQPDLGLVLLAGAVTGVAWAVLRLAVAHTGRTRPAEQT